jgi:hypothetical protein
MKGFY